MSVVTGADGAGTGASAGAALRSAAQQAAAHGGGMAVDITAINDIPIAGHQGPGSVTDAAIRTLLTLHGRFAPHRIVSLMRYPEAPSTEALPAAWNHIHLEFLPVRATAAAHVAAAGPAAASPLAASGDLDEAQWSQLIGRIAALPKPKVSRHAQLVGDPRPAGGAHQPRARRGRPGRGRLTAPSGAVGGSAAGRGAARARMGAVGTAAHPAACSGTSPPPL